MRRFRRHLLQLQELCRVPCSSRFKGTGGSHLNHWYRSNYSVMMGAYNDQKELAESNRQNQEGKGKGKDKGKSKGKR